MKQKALIVITMMSIVTLLPMLLSGCHSHTMSEATCTTPPACTVCGKTEGEALGHNWSKATCTEPRTCTTCGETDGKAIGHKWSEATCTEPRKCSVCKATDGEAPGHNWSAATATTPKTCSVCGLMEPMDLPESGTIVLGTKPSYYYSSELTIKNQANDSCFVKLKDTSLNDVFGFFVRAGDDITVSVPMGTFYCYFAYGDEWYGPEYRFGDNSYYGKDDTPCDFSQYTLTYTLYPVTNGNYTETKISEEEFD